MRSERWALDVFSCPTCGARLVVDSECDATTCGGCGRTFDATDGVIDFVSERSPGSERAYYDQYYRSHAPESPPDPLDLGALTYTWTGRDAPWEMHRVWERLGNLEGKTVLLLGNGESRAELYMLTQSPRALIYSDLSPIGLAALASELPDKGNVVFAAIDALDLPLRDGTVDLVYGFAFAHHLPDLERFLVEVARVLRPGGRAVFMDNGYSPLWQHVKLVWLRPLMWLSHRRERRSPEDIRDTMTGGLREDVLSEQIRAVGGQPWFERVAFLYFYWKRASVSLFPGLFRPIPRHELISRSLMRLDLRLARWPFIRRNMIRLIWGFDKPPGAGTIDGSTLAARPTAVAADG
jgi:SAM-dependent methyltransferase